MFSLPVVCAFIIFLSSIPDCRPCIRTYNEDKETEATTPYVTPTTPFTSTPEPDICSQCALPKLSSPNGECASETFPIPIDNVMKYEENGKCYLQVICIANEVRFSVEPGLCEPGAPDPYDIVCVNGKFMYYDLELMYISCRYS